MYQVQLVVDASGQWSSNGLRFDKYAEAVTYADDLMDRWAAVRDWRVMRDGREVAFSSQLEAS